MHSACADLLPGKLPASGAARPRRGTCHPVLGTYPMLELGRDGIEPSTSGLKVRQSPSAPVFTLPLPLCKSLFLWIFSPHQSIIRYIQPQRNGNGTATANVSA